MTGRGQNTAQSPLNLAAPIPERDFANPPPRLLMFRRCKMPELSQHAIRELRQSLPLLERLKERFSSHDTLTGDEFTQLQRALDRVSSLTDYSQFRTWVGGDLERPKDGWYASVTYTVEEHHIAIAERLCLYTQEILENQKIEEKLDFLTQENASLKEQLAELRRRESTYLSVIKKAQTSARYSPSPSPKDKEILLNSYRRQRTILIKNLTRYQEDKAKYGLNAPVHIQNAIDQTEEDIKRIEARIADLEKEPS
jgi:hypothetical protein